MHASLWIVFAAHLSVVTAFVNYGDNVYLQVQNHGSRWLTGGRGTNNVYVRLDSHAQSAAAQYQWQIRSNPGTGAVGFADPSAQQCVKYGDIVYLQVQNLGSRWLTGGRDDTAGSVYTKDYLDGLEQSAPTTYKWQIRSSPGTDSANQCVNYGDRVHLKVENLGSGWLKGGEDGDRAHTENHPDGVSVAAYQWQIRSNARNEDFGKTNSIPSRDRSPSTAATATTTTTTTTTTSTTEDVQPISEASPPQDTDEGSNSMVDPVTESDTGSAGAEDAQDATPEEL